MLIRYSGVPFSLDEPHEFAERPFPLIGTSVPDPMRQRLQAMLTIFAYLPPCVPKSLGLDPFAKLEAILDIPPEDPRIAPTLNKLQQLGKTFFPLLAENIPRPPGQWLQAFLTLKRQFPLLER